MPPNWILSVWNMKNLSDCISLRSVCKDGHTTLIKSGSKKSDIAASIYQAVVEQTITGLAQGRKIEGNVLFLGGPLFFLKGLQKRFVESLHLTEEHAIFPELAPYFVALGSAYYAANTEESFLSRN